MDPSNRFGKAKKPDTMQTPSAAGFRVPSTPPRFTKESEESRKSILNDVQVPTTCTPHNLRFIGASEMRSLCLAAASGDQKTPLNFFVYQPECPWCRAAFPEYLGAAWIAACRPNDGPFYAVSSVTMRDEEGRAARRKLDIQTFPALFRVERDRVIKLTDPSQRTVSGFLEFFKRKLATFSDGGRDELRQTFFPAHAAPSLSRKRLAHAPLDPKWRQLQ